MASWWWDAVLIAGPWLRRDEPLRAGSILAVDATGEWFLGRTIEQALDLLITGRRPRLVEPGDGHRSPRQPEPVSEDSVMLSGMRNPIGAAFFLDRTPANRPYSWLPDVLARIGSSRTPAMWNLAGS